MKPILYIIGLVLCILACGMTFPLLVDLNQNHNDWEVFAVCMGITGFFGGALALSNRSSALSLTSRQVFIITVFGWLTVTLFAALPFKLSILDLSTEDAFFEAMSGITTTGATVITDLSQAPPGILLWRAILQWLGGIGILIMGIAILPYLKIGGMELFGSTSTSGQQGINPRLYQLSKSIIALYIILSMLCALSYNFAGFNFFDSYTHAMTTVSTGGFSNQNGSFLHYKNPKAETVAIFFMFLSALPFALLIKSFNTHCKDLIKDTQTQTFCAIALIATLTLIAWLIIKEGIARESAITTGLFTTLSTITGTGYANSDTALWSGLPLTLLLFLMAIGGCAGSTTCGIKIFRFQILYQLAKSQLSTLIQPHGVFPPRYQKKIIAKHILVSVMAFVFVFALSFLAGVLALSLMNIDFLTTISAVMACLANVGPGFGDIIGPTGTYAPLPEAAKWTLSFLMLLGRLEIFTVLVIASPLFWKS